MVTPAVVALALLISAPAVTPIRWGMSVDQVLATDSRIERNPEPGSRKKPPLSTFKLRIKDGDAQFSFGFDESGFLNALNFQRSNAANFNAFRALAGAFVQRFGPPDRTEDKSVSASREWRRGETSIELQRLFLPGASSKMDLLFVSMLGTDGSNGPQPHEVLLEITGALGGAKTPSNLSAEGYKDTKWGMSKQEVEPLVPEALEAGGRLIAKGSTGGKESATGYTFVNGRLVQVVVLFTSSYVNKNHYIDDYKELQQLLKQKYGDPRDDATEWRNPLYKDVPSSWGTAVSAGHLRYQTQWDTPLTRITLKCNGENFKITLSLRYDSKEFEGEKVEQDEQDKLKDL